MKQSQGREVIWWVTENSKDQIGTEFQTPKFLTSTLCKDRKLEKNYVKNKKENKHYSTCVWQPFPTDLCCSQSLVDSPQAPELCASWYSGDSKGDFHLPREEKFVQKQTNPNKFQVFFVCSQFLKWWMRKGKESYKSGSSNRVRKLFFPWFNEPWILTFVRSEKHNLKHTQL